MNFQRQCSLLRLMPSLLGVLWFALLLFALPMATYAKAVTAPVKIGFVNPLDSPATLHDNNFRVSLANDHKPERSPPNSDPPHWVIIASSMALAEHQFCIAISIPDRAEHVFDHNIHLLPYLRAPPKA